MRKMAHLMHYMVTVICVNVKVPAMANFCKLYYNDGYQYYSYTTYCSLGCCDDICCNNYQSNSQLSGGQLIGIICGCLFGFILCCIFCFCAFKYCCKSKAAQAGQIIRQPGQQIAYIQPTAIPTQAISNGQQCHTAYRNPEVIYNDPSPPTYEAALLYPKVAPSYYTSPDSVVSTDATFTNIATVSEDNVTSPSSVPDVLPSTDISLPPNTKDHATTSTERYA